MLPAYKGQETPVGVGPGSQPGRAQVDKAMWENTSPTTCQQGSHTPNKVNMIRHTARIRRSRGPGAHSHPASTDSQLSRKAHSSSSQQLNKVSTLPGWQTQPITILGHGAPKPVPMLKAKAYTKKHIKQCSLTDNNFWGCVTRATLFSTPSLFLRLRGG